MGHVRAIKFIVLNGVGALVWAVVVGTAGYLFGHAVEAVLGEIKHFEKWLLIAVVSVVGAVWTIHFIGRRRCDKAACMDRVTGDSLKADHFVQVLSTKKNTDDGRKN